VLVVNPKRLSSFVHSPMKKLILAAIPPLPCHSSNTSTPSPLKVFVFLFKQSSWIVKGVILFNHKTSLPNKILYIAVHFFNLPAVSEVCTSAQFNNHKALKKIVFHFYCPFNLWKNSELPINWTVSLLQKNRADPQHAIKTRVHL
jgi:hypothetical protein